MNNSSVAWEKTCFCITISCLDTAALSVMHTTVSQISKCCTSYAIQASEQGNKMSVDGTEESNQKQEALNLNATLCLFLVAAIGYDTKNANKNQTTKIITPLSNWLSCQHTSLARWLMFSSHSNHFLLGLTVYTLSFFSFFLFSCPGIKTQHLFLFSLVN